MVRWLSDRVPARTLAARREGTVPAFGAIPTGRPRRAFGDTIDASRDWTPARQAREKDEHGGVSVAE
jgi:hypothetical protein